MKPLRIMYFPGKISGGVGTVVMNIFRNIDRDKFVIDFCVPDSDAGLFDSEIIQAGSRIFHIPQIRKVGPIRFITTVKSILKENGPYDAVHVHSVHMGALAIVAAKKSGIKKRIYHVHNTQDAALDRLPFHNLVEALLKKTICRNSTVYLACGKDAGRYIYGSKEFSVVNNAVSFEKFHPVSECKRREIRESLNIDCATCVVGNIARFSTVKNQSKFVELAALDKQKQNKLKFLLVGDGETLGEVKEQAVNQGCEEKIIFMGQRNDTDQLYNAMDVFCLPSLFEGLPVTMIEAQSCGVPCVVSDAVTRECDLGISKVDFISLSQTNDRWLTAFYSAVTERVEDEQLIFKKLKQQKYELRTMVKQVEEIYSQM